MVQAMFPDLIGNSDSANSIIKNAFTHFLPEHKPQNSPERHRKIYKARLGRDDRKGCILRISANSPSKNWRNLLKLVRRQYFDKSDLVSNMAADSPNSTADEDISKKRRSARLEIARIKNFLSREVDGYYSQMNKSVRILTEEENAAEEVIQKSMTTASEGVKNFHFYVKNDKELAISYIQDAAEIIEGCLNMLNNIPQEFMFLKKIADEMNKLAELLKGIREISEMKSGRLEIAEAVKSLLSYVGVFSYLMDIRKQESTEEEYEREKAYHTIMLNISNKLENLDSSVKEDKEWAIRMVQDAAEIIECSCKMIRKAPGEMIFFEKIAEKCRSLAKLLEEQSEESDDSAESDSGDNDEPSAKRAKPMTEKSV